MTYSVIDAIAIIHEPASSAAEIHGIATGMLCLDNQADGMTWINEIFQHAEALLEEDKAMLMGLFDQTQDFLTGDEFGFDLLLPDDEFTLDEQAEGIRNWCQGFLFGFGFSSSAKEMPDEALEIINDIVEISKLGLDDDSDEDEQQLMEVHEYLRAAVMLLHEELISENASEHPRQIH
jgi:uncharacterized protein YgfB (UPF0149 family)